MALDVGRWLKYAQAKLNAAARAGHDELDQLEAQREVELAEKPWLASDSEAPTFDEARARIEYEADRAQSGPDAPSGEAPRAPEPTKAPVPPANQQADAEVAQARIELDRQARESKERLEAIRKELGVDEPEKP